MLIQNLGSTGTSSGATSDSNAQKAPIGVGSQKSFLDTFIKNDKVKIELMEKAKYEAPEGIVVKDGKVEKDNRTRYQYWALGSSVATINKKLTDKAEALAKLKKDFNVEIPETKAAKTESKETTTESSWSLMTPFNFVWSGIKSIFSTLLWLVTGCNYFGSSTTSEGSETSSS